MSDTYADLRHRDRLQERAASSAAAWARRQDAARWALIDPSLRPELDQGPTSTGRKRARIRRAR